MNERHFSDLTFSLALKRARAAEAVELKAAVEGRGAKPSADLHQTLDRLARDRMNAALCGHRA